jgi:hypothetical protein
MFYCFSHTEITFAKVHFFSKTYYENSLQDRRLYSTIITSEVFIRPILLEFIDFRDVNITILDISYRPVFYLKHNVLETRFCLRLQLERIQFHPYRQS